jgi:hypothetical protein
MSKLRKWKSVRRGGRKQGKTLLMVDFETHSFVGFDFARPGSDRTAVVVYVNGEPLYIGDGQDPIT